LERPDGFLQKVFGVEFDDTVYLVCQAAGALATLIIFYNLLSHLGATRVRALLAAICLAFQRNSFLTRSTAKNLISVFLFLLAAVRLLVVRPGTSELYPAVVVNLLLRARDRLPA